MSTRRRLTLGKRRASNASVTTSCNHQRPAIARRCFSLLVCAISIRSSLLSLADSVSTGPATEISSFRARRRITEAGAWGTGASWLLSSAKAIRALISAMARSSMVLIRRSKTSLNNSVCSWLKRPADAKNKAVTRPAISAHFCVEPAATAASTSLAIDKGKSDIARPERHCLPFLADWPTLLTMPKRFVKLQPNT